MTQAQPEIIGVRHHSPACSRLVQTRIRSLKPRHVLIEGPADFNGRMKELLLPHRLPVAIYSYLSAGTVHRGSWSPFAEHSPEWQALVEGQAAGAQLRFCDLPAWHPAFSDMENRYADVADAEQEAAGATYEQALADRLSVQGDDALWDHLFEGLTEPAQMDELAQRLATHFVQLRGDTPGSLGNQQREQMMARWLAWAVQDAQAHGWNGEANAQGGVLLVCGGFHAPMLARLWPQHLQETGAQEGQGGQAFPMPETPVPDVAVLLKSAMGISLSPPENEASDSDTEEDAEDGDKDLSDSEPDSALPELRHGSFLVPYSFARLDAFAGYASGMPSPAWYEWLWQHGPDVAATRLLHGLSQRMRGKKLPMSTADLMAAHSRAQGLARLRGHAWPHRVDWLDAMAGALVKEALDVPLPWTYRGTLQSGTAPVLVQAMDVLAGQQQGQLASGTPQPPLVAAVASELGALGLWPLSGERVLNLLQPQDRQRSQALHRLRLLDVPGVTRTSGGDLALAGEVSERWKLGSPLAQSAALIEAGAWGGTLFDACRARLEHLLLEAGHDIAALARLLNTAAWAGMAVIGDQAMQRLQDAVSQTQQLEPLGDALATLHTMVRHGQALGMADSPMLHAVLQAGFDRALWLLELPSHVTPQTMEAHLRVHQALRQVVADALADASEASEISEATQAQPSVSRASHGDAGDASDAVHEAAAQGLPSALPLAAVDAASPALAPTPSAPSSPAPVLTAQRLAARAVAVWLRKLHDTQSAPVSRGAALGVLIDLGDRFDMASVDARAAASASDWSTQALGLLGSMPVGGLGDALSGLLALARHAIERSPGFVQGLDALVQQLSSDDFVLALPALRAAFAWLPLRERGVLARQLAGLHGAGDGGAGSGGDWRQLLARLPSQTNPLAMAQAQRDERAAVARLQHWGVWPDPVGAAATNKEKA